MRRTRKAATKAVTRRRTGAPLEGHPEVAQAVAGIETHHETSPLLSGGDVDADWLQAHLSGEEAVGGSVATPDQDVVDEIGRALGVEQGLDAEVRSLEDVVRGRDRDRWALEEDAAAEERRR